MTSAANPHLLAVLEWLPIIAGCAGLFIRPHFALQDAVKIAKDWQLGIGEHHPTTWPMLEKALHRVRHSGVPKTKVLNTLHEALSQTMVIDAHRLNLRRTFYFRMLLTLAIYMAIRILSGGSHEAEKVMMMLVLVTLVVLAAVAVFETFLPSHWLDERGDETLHDWLLLTAGLNASATSSSKLKPLVKAEQRHRLQGIATSSLRSRDFLRWVTEEAEVSKRALARAEDLLPCLELVAFGLIVTLALVTVG